MANIEFVCRAKLRARQHIWLEERPAFAAEGLGDRDDTIYGVVSRPILPVDDRGDVVDRTRPPYIAARGIKVSQRSEHGACDLMFFRLNQGEKLIRMFINC